MQSHCESGYCPPPGNGPGEVIISLGQISYPQELFGVGARHVVSLQMHRRELLNRRVNADGSSCGFPKWLRDLPPSQNSASAYTGQCEIGRTAFLDDCWRWDNAIVMKWPRVLAERP